MCCTNRNFFLFYSNSLYIQSLSSRGWLHAGWMPEFETKFLQLPFYLASVYMKNISARAEFRISVLTQNNFYKDSKSAVLCVKDISSDRKHAKQKTSFFVPVPRNFLSGNLQPLFKRFVKSRCLKRLWHEILFNIFLISFQRSLEITIYCLW